MFVSSYKKKRKKIDPYEQVVSDNGSNENQQSSDSDFANENERPPSQQAKYRREQYKKLPQEQKDAINRKQNERNQKLPQEQKDAKNRKRREQYQKFPLTQEQKDAKNRRRRELAAATRAKKAMSPSTAEEHRCHLPKRKNRETEANLAVRVATRHAISPNYNTTFEITRAALYFPKPVGGRATIDNCKKEGWTVGIKLLVDIDDRTTLFKLKQEAKKLGMTVDQMMIILKDQLENCSATICIESDINNNSAIQEILAKMRYIMGGEEKYHSLHQNTKPVSARHANYGRGKIEGKYDDYTTAFHPGTVGVACSLLRSPEPKMIEAIAPEATTPTVAPEPKNLETKQPTVRKFTARHADKHSCPTFFNILSNNDSSVEYYFGNILVGRLHIKAGFSLVYTTEIHTDNKVFNPLKLKHCSEGASDRLLYRFVHMPPNKGLNMKGRDSKNSIQELDFAIDTIFGNKLKK